MSDTFRAREADIKIFLKTAGWERAQRAAAAGDASSRRYERLTLDGKKAILMDAPRGAEAPAEPIGADEAARRALGYNAMARLAGPEPAAFVCIAQALETCGFSAPHILARDLKKGFLLLEDLGDDLFAQVIKKDPSKEAQLYAAAVDTLAAIYRSSFAQDLTSGQASWRLRAYDRLALQTEVDLLLEWYGADLGVDIDEAARKEWTEIWTQLFTALEAHAPGLALRDFHAENIFWLPERQATARVGLIDFQDGLLAHPAYDLVSLLEDARRDVRPDLRGGLIARFCEKAGLENDAAFQNAYAVMGAQRNAKILGIFVRLAIRDNKPAYRRLIPRVKNLFLGDIQGPLFGPLRGWLLAHMPELLKPAITNAMVLAAGHGTRMRPLTHDRSKAMVEVGGEPLIAHMLGRLAEAGVTRAVVNVHAHADHLESYLKSRKGLPDIIISDEREQLLETGGGVVKALELLGEGPAYICNIDAVWRESQSALGGLYADWNPELMDDLLLLAPIGETLGYSGRGDFERGKDGVITRRIGDHASFVYAGVQIANLDPLRAFEAVPFSRNKVWDVSLSAGRAYGSILEGFWMHVGDPKARDEAEIILKQDRRASQAAAHDG
jgi:aminoglycoside/choline kinase family phosphotransferase